MYNQFCAGETDAETRDCVRQLKDLGFKGVILTYARETVFDHKTNASTQHADDTGLSLNEKTATEQDAAVEAWRVGTLETVDLIDEGDILAIK